jgi:diacylglycerol O-acyltransferase / wax synthase
MGELSGLDVAFLCLERPTRPMHLGAVAIFDGPPPPGLLTLLADRAAGTPLLGQRIAGRAWQPDPAFDATRHLRAYEVPDQRVFEAYAAGWLATPLDLTRPPWDLHVVTGLPGGRFGVLLKLHHALTDGAGAVGIGGALLDLAAPVPSSGRSVTPLTRTVSNAGAVLRAVRLPPVPALVTSAGSAGRRLAFVRFDLADVRQIRRQHGGTTNDVTLAVLAGGLRSWLGEPSATPRALIPVNTRARGGGAGGNQLSGYLCDLPVAVADPVARLRAVRSAMDRNKAAGPTRGAGTLPLLADRIPAALHRVGTPIAGAGAPLLFDTVVTNVPLPRIPLTLGGAPLREIYPFAPLAPGHTLGVGVSEYDDTVHIGLVADREAVPDLDALAAAITKAATTLHELCA